MGIRPSINDQLQTLPIMDFSMFYVLHLCGWKGPSQDIGNREEKGPAAVLHVIALRHRRLENLNALNL